MKLKYIKPVSDVVRRKIKVVLFRAKIVNSPVHTSPDKDFKSNVGYEIPGEYWDKAKGALENKGFKEGESYKLSQEA